MQELARAASLAQSGRLEEAALIYRKVIAAHPEQAEAIHFLGVCLVKSGSAEEGFQQLERSVRLAPAQSLYRQNFALMLAEAGRLEEAESQFIEFLAREPRNPQAHNWLGMVRQRQGRFDEAITRYREALQLAPGDAGTANNLGFCLFERGDLEGALQWYGRALAAAPGNAMVHNNLGNVQRAMHRPDRAIDCYRRAVELDPSLALGWHNLARMLRDADPLAALDAAWRAVRHAPDYGPGWQLFGEVFAVSRCTAWNGEFADDCARLLSRPDVEVSSCAEATLSLLRTNRAVWPTHPLFLLLIENALVADPDFETELVQLRRSALSSPPSLELACALAQQCFLNEYLWPESSEETVALERLKGNPAPLDLALLGCYRPLRGFGKPSGGGEAFERMWRRLVAEPAAEVALGETIETLTPIEDDVSRVVRSQYEENPYPRWHRAPSHAPFPLRLMLRTLFPDFDPAGLPDAPDILIAGCGTGRHAAITASLQPLARVLAVDISRTSLAHALRRCRELGLTNVRFAQADLLQLGNVGQRFDLIECSGVLHHLRDPLEGWRVLLSLLNAGGLMKVGLYSEIARRHVVAARAVVSGLPVREARARILALPPGHPARQAATWRDFYSASGARDLILHVQEHRFTIGRLTGAIEALGLEFIGFEFHDGHPAPARYRAQFTDDPKGNSLANWEVFEQSYPDTFRGMYQLWVRKLLDR